MSWAESSWTVNQVVDKINKDFKVSPGYTLFKITDTDVQSDENLGQTTSVIINSFTTDLAGIGYAYIVMRANGSRATGDLFITTISTPTSTSNLSKNYILNLSYNGNFNDTTVMYYKSKLQLEANTTYYIHMTTSRATGTLYSNSYIQYPNSSISGSVIKSIQSGNITNSVITINQVNPLKSVVIINNSSSTSSVALNKIMPDTLVFSSTDSSGSWQLIEFY